MADKSVGELIAAQSVTPTDLFVLEQNGTAKKLTGQILENWLVSFADGHGGIQSIVKKSTSGLVDTYRITLADTTTFDFMVTNGKGINSVSKVSTSGLVDTYQIAFNDRTSSTFTVTNGEKGDKGDRANIWVKYASQKPTASSHSFGDVPDSWIGIATGHNMDTAPTDWQQYTWFQWKGEKGDTGDPATLISAEIRYQVGDSGTIMPSGSWSESVPPVTPGKFLWTRQVLKFNTGAPITSYSISRFGIDGTGSVSTVAGISPNADGNVPLTAADVKALPIPGGTMEGPINMNGQKLSGLNAPTKDDEAATKRSSESFTNTQITDRVINGKGKNLLKNAVKSQTVDGVTFTVNADGSVTVNGTATSNFARLYLKRETDPYVYYGGMILSGGTSKVSITIQAGAQYEYAIYAESKGDESVISTEMKESKIFIGVNNGETVSNETIYPMIRLASETDDTYEPYYAGLKELTDRGMELLWENAAVTSDFGNQTLNIDLSGYSFVRIVARVAKNNPYEENSEIGVSCSGYVRNVAVIDDSSYKFAIKSRALTVTTTGISFDNCKEVNYKDTAAITNRYMIPYKIYGIKGVIT